MLQSASIEYKHDGYLCEALPFGTKRHKTTGILVFPEWVGVGEYTFKRAQMLGDLGFNAFVVDVYGKGIRPNTPAGSTGRCNTGAKSLCWGFEFQSLPWPFV